MKYENSFTYTPEAIRGVGPEIMRRLRGAISAARADGYHANEMHVELSHSAWSAVLYENAQPGDSVDYHAEMAFGLPVRVVEDPASPDYGGHFLRAVVRVVAETDLERRARLTRAAGVTVYDYKPLEVSPPAPEPTLRAVVGKWFKKARRRA